MPVQALRRRQVPVTGIAPPTASGIFNTAKVVDTAAAAGATGLAIDQSATTRTSAAPIHTITITTPDSSIPTSTSPSDPTASVGTTEGSSAPIALSTVIGACVGAFIGATAFIILAIFFYRRYSQSLKRQAVRRGTPRSMADQTRNGRPDSDRRRSRVENWDKLNDDDMEDKWEGMHGKAPVSLEVKEMDTLTAGLFQKSPSSLSHQSTEEAPNSAGFRMSQTSSTVTPRVPEARDLLGREPQNMLGQIDYGPPMSWGSDTKASFLSNTRMSGGAMSPTLSMAIPTPPAVKSQLHRWESAEVIHFEGQSAEVVEQPEESIHNPFFNASSDYPIHNRGRSNSSAKGRSRSSSNATINQRDASSSRKDRVISIDPFRDPLPKPTFLHHYPTQSTSSSSSNNDRAIRQLVAAASLEDLSEDEVQRRLRVASMQPSIISHSGSQSGDSMYTDAEPDPVDDAVMRSFPFPPSSSGHETHYNN